MRHFSFRPSLSLAVLGVLIWVFSCKNEAQSPSQSQMTMETDQIPKGMFLVTPTEATATPNQTNEVPPKNLRVMRGSYFSYVLPEGWKLGEDGQYALSIVAPDQKALTLMVGNAGLLPDMTPGQYVHDKMMALRPENLQIGPGKSCPPINGFQYAVIFPVTYSIGGVPCQGLVKCNAAPYYGGVTMVMTAALSEAKQWNGYSSWLPLIADQISAHDGAAFGMRGIMQQNIDNSRAYADAAAKYREWSQNNWQAVTDDRNATVDRQQKEVRENLGAVQTFQNPYDNSKPLALTTQYQYYWIDQHGRVLGSNDPSINPNQGSTSEWRQMEKQK